MRGGGCQHLLIQNRHFINTNSFFVNKISSLLILILTDDF